MLSVGASAGFCSKDWDDEKPAPAAEDGRSCKWEGEGCGVEGGAEVKFLINAQLGFNR